MKAMFDHQAHDEALARAEASRMYGNALTEEMWRQVAEKCLSLSGQPAGRQG